MIKLFLGTEFRAHVSRLDLAMENPLEVQQLTRIVEY